MGMNEAVELSIDMWEFLAEDGSRDKEDHPEFKEVYREMYDKCPLCDIGWAECDRCPLMLFHPKEINCYHDESPFQEWNIGTIDADNIPIREEKAQEIVEILKRWEKD